MCAKVRSTILSYSPLLLIQPEIQQSGDRPRSHSSLAVAHRPQQERSLMVRDFFILQINHPTGCTGSRRQGLACMSVYQNPPEKSSRCKDLVTPPSILSGLTWIRGQGPAYQASYTAWISIHLGNACNPPDVAYMVDTGDLLD